MTNAQLNARLRAANPVPVESVPPGLGHSRMNRFMQVALAVLAAMSVGVGAAWATSGTNPFSSLFSNTVKLSESEVGRESISALQPMTQESLETLEPRIAETAVVRAAGETARQMRLEGQAPLSLRKAASEPDPTTISAFAQVKTNLGTPAILLVVDDTICSFTGPESYGVSDCAALDDVGEGEVITWRSETDSPNLKHVTGLFDDQVAAIDVAGDAKPPIRISGNVLELRNVDSRSISLVGFDDRGRELFRNKTTLSSSP
ncbi:MAG: hypothetical protein QG596_55 [Actinomycetota bacterium]|jgi:hypothetical protein|nr:hypothetical protein [Actinomycetota bacterium]